MSGETEIGRTAAILRNDDATVLSAHVERCCEFVEQIAETEPVRVVVSACLVGQLSFEAPEAEPDLGKSESTEAIHKALGVYCTRWAAFP